MKAEEFRLIAGLAPNRPDKGEERAPASSPRNDDTKQIQQQI